MDEMNAAKTLEPVVDSFIRVVGSGIEVFGVVVIVIGIAWSTYRQLRQPVSEQDSDVYKIRIGRSLLLGLEVLVAADIVKTVALDLGFVHVESGPLVRSSYHAHETADAYSRKSQVASL